MQKAPRQTMTAPIRRMRFVWVALIFIGWTASIGLRLGWLQVVRHGHYVETAAKQQQRTFEVAPRRGVLYDRNLRELAMTVLVDSVYAVPSELGENRAECGGAAGEDCAHGSARQLYVEAADAGAIQCFEELCVGGATVGCGDGDAGAGAESERCLSAEGVQAVLSEQRSGCAGAGICGDG